MKTFVLVAVVACAALVLLEISESNAHRWGHHHHHHHHHNNRRCWNRPALRSVDNVNCQRWPHRHQLLQCQQRCRQCYGREQLAEQVGCLARGSGWHFKHPRCVCLSNGEEVTTTEGSVEPSTTTGNPEEPSTTTGNPEEPSTTTGNPEEPSTTVNPEEPSSEAPVEPSTENPGEPSSTEGGVTDETTLPADVENPTESIA